MTTTAGPTFKMTYAMAVTGDPRTLAATYKAMADGATMTLAKEHVLGTMIGHVLKAGPTADKLEVSYVAVRSATAGITKYSPNAAEFGQHAFVGATRFSQIMQVLDEAGLDSTRADVENISEAYAVICKRFKEAAANVPRDKLLIIETDLMCDGDSHNAGTDTFFDHFTLGGWSLGEGEASVEKVALQIFSGAHRATGRGGRNSDEFTELLEAIKSAVGRDISAL